MPLNKLNITNNIFSLGANKLFAFPKELKQWMKGQPIVPIALEIHPSARCNHRCPKCQGRFVVGNGFKNNLNKRRYYLDVNFLELIWKNPPKGIIISGSTGDPLLHPEIGHILNRVYDFKIPVVLITNGEGFNQDIADIATKACSGIRISLDAYDCKSYRNAHGVGERSWCRVLENIKMLLEARSTIGSSDCSIGIGYLTSPSTKDGMVDATLLAKDLGVDYIQFRPYHYEACLIDFELGKCSILEDYPKFKVLASYQKYSLVDSFQRCYTSCNASNFYTVLDAQGDLYICCHHVGRPDAKVCSLKDQSWLEFIDDNSRYKLACLYPNDNCVPMCRLHTQNEILDRVIQTKRIPRVKLSNEIYKHAPFL